MRRISVLTLLAYGMLTLAAAAMTDGRLDIWIGRSPMERIDGSTFFDKFAAPSEQGVIFEASDLDTSTIWGGVNKTLFRFPVLGNSFPEAGYLFAECYVPLCTSGKYPATIWYVSFTSEIGGHQQFDVFQTYLESDKSTVDYCRLAGGNYNPFLGGLQPVQWGCFKALNGKMPAGTRDQMAQQVWMTYNALEEGNAPPPAKCQWVPGPVIGDPPHQEPGHVECGPGFRD